MGSQHGHGLDHHEHDHHDHGKAGSAFRWSIALNSGLTALPGVLAVEELARQRLAALGIRKCTLQLETAQPVPSAQES